MGHTNSCLTPDNKTQHRTHLAGSSGMAQTSANLCRAAPPNLTSSLIPTEKFWFLELNRPLLVFLCLHNTPNIGSGCCTLHTDNIVQKTTKGSRGTELRSVLASKSDNTSNSFLPVYFSWASPSQCSWDRLENWKLSPSSGPIPAFQMSPSSHAWGAVSFHIQTAPR